MMPINVGLGVIHPKVQVVGCAGILAHCPSKCQCYASVMKVVFTIYPRFVQMILASSHSMRVLQAINPNALFLCMVDEVDLFCMKHKLIAG